MRFPVAAILFVIASFIFFVIWAVSSYLLETVADALLPHATTEASNIITLLQNAFGILAALFFVIGIILIFILDATADEPEMYWRR